MIACNTNRLKMKLIDTSNSSLLSKKEYTRITAINLEVCFEKPVNDSFVIKV